jgi:hypothetical protein
VVFAKKLHDTRSVGLKQFHNARSSGPEGVAGCSHGWSDARAQPRDAEPVEGRSSSPSRPGGAAEGGD